MDFIRTLADFFAKELNQRSNIVAEMASTHFTDALKSACDAIVSAFKEQRKVLLFGNGGPASVADHMSAEFVGGMRFDRHALPAISLSSNGAIVTAVSNDDSSTGLFARQISALGTRGHVAVGLSASGPSPNVLAGLAEARQMSLVTIAMTGEEPETVGAASDIALSVPSRETPQVQECHLIAGHLIREVVERELTVHVS